jgi:hypothetical protein
VDDGLTRKYATKVAFEAVFLPRSLPMQDLDALGPPVRCVWRGVFTIFMRWQRLSLAHEFLLADILLKHDVDDWTNPRRPSWGTEVSAVDAWMGRKRISPVRPKVREALHEL